MRETEGATRGIAGRRSAAAIRCCRVVGVAFAMALLGISLWPIGAQAQTGPATYQSSTPVAPTLLTTTTTNVQTAISARIKNIVRVRSLTNVASLPPGESGSAGGMSAGDERLGLGVWLDGPWSHFEEDADGAAFEGDSYSIIGGLDYMLTDRTLAGLTFTYSHSDTDTTFNGGNIKSDGYTIAPFAAYVFNRYVYADANFGFSWLDYDQERTGRFNGTSFEPFSPPTRIRGGFDSTRWFAAANLNGVYTVGDVNLSAQLGYLFAHESQDEFMESDGTVVGRNRIDLGQVRAGGEAGYLFGFIEPYGTVQFEWDHLAEDVDVAIGEQPDNKDTGWRLGGGLRFYVDDWLSGGVEVTTVEGRGSLDGINASGNIRVGF